MQRQVPAAPRVPQPLWVVVLCAGLIVGVAMGRHQVMGLYLPPMTAALGTGVEPFSTAMAIFNLVWGMAAVFAGLIADRYGAGRVVVSGIVATVAGLYVMYIASSPLDLMVSGVLLGIGISGTGITALVGAAGRAAPPDKRTAAIAALGMAGGIGGFVAFPYMHLLMELVGWRMSLLLLAGTVAAVLPLAWPLGGRPPAMGHADNQTFGQAFSEAVAHPSYLLLNMGFFVCGFHVAFYGVHLPRFVADAGLDKSVGIWALTAVGLANLVGTYIAGASPRFIEKRLGLSLIYFGRCFVFLGLLFLPITGATVIALSALLGLFWLSTVPLTSGLVATFFGTRWMSMLFGLVFLSHQVGSFSGLWLAGVLYDATHSYDMMWWISIAVGLMAAAVHLPIKDRPVARLAAAPAE
jgi:predicted MFS family arabinose efflux permease